MNAKQSFLIAFKIVPLLLLLSQIVLALSAKYNPIADADILLSEYQDSIRLLVGFESQSTTKTQETYLIINPGNLASHTVKIELINGQGKITQEKEGGLFSFILAELVLIAAIWWAWFKPDGMTKKFNLPAKNIDSDRP